MPDVDAYQLSLHATGTYGDARAVMDLANRYAGIFAFGAMDLTTLSLGADAAAGSDTINGITSQLDQLNTQLNSTSFSDDMSCPIWETVRNFLWKCKACASSLDAGRAATISNIESIPGDVVDSAKNVAQTIEDTAASVLNWTPWLVGAAALATVWFFYLKEKA